MTVEGMSAHRERTIGGRADAVMLRSGSLLWKAWDDLRRAIRHWPVFLLIATTDIKARYRRSRIGQFWITISLAITILALGVVWSFLWKMPLGSFFPFIAVSHVFFSYLTNYLNESPAIFVTSAPYLREFNLPKSTYVFAALVRQLIILAHNAVILAPVFLFFGVAITWRALWFVPAFLLTTLTLFAMSAILAIAGARFRDVASLVVNLTQVAFFVTPVIWMPKMIPEEYKAYLLLNPFAVYLELLRAPLLGSPVPWSYWGMAFLYAILALLLAGWLFIRYRGRIVYWL